VNTVITDHPDSPPASGVDDPFHDPVIIGIGITFVIVGIVILALTILFTWETLDGAPSWNSHAFPPPIVH
jgi:hypothetical protein